MTRTGRLEPVTLTPIGVIRTPFPDKASAPRQPAAAKGARGRIELFTDARLEHALQDLSSFEFIWLIFHFHLSRCFRGKVLPPRSLTRRGVFATRAPHRPNPIGMSLVRLKRIEAPCLDVLDVDMIDETPLLDIKPYLPYADVAPDRLTVGSTTDRQKRRTAIRSRRSTSRSPLAPQRKSRFCAIGAAWISHRASERRSRSARPRTPTAASVKTAMVSGCPCRIGACASWSRGPACGSKRS